MNLRPYQEQSRSELAVGFKTHKRQILCQPTGSGKTVVFSSIAARAAQRGLTVLIVTDRIELFKQTFGSVERAGIEVSLIHAGSKKTATIDAFSSGEKTVFLAMVETLKRRAAKGYVSIKPDLIIIDEAHKRSFEPIMDIFTDAMVIGATATPVGLHLHRYYTNIIQPIDIPELIDGGWLVPCIAYQMKEDLSDLKTKAGEYTPESLGSHYNKKALFNGVVKEYLEKAEGKKTLVFNVSIEHATNMTNAFLEAGIHAECVTSETPPSEREDRLTRFKNGMFPVLNNCGILTTGYDEPSIECIIMNRATKSLALWLQCCGRGSRPYIGKANFIVLDFGMNHDQHGLWSQPRQWEIEQPKKKKERLLDVAPVKNCPKCEAVIFASATSCIFCGYKFPEVGAKLKDGVMVRVDETEMRIISGLRISQLTMKELAMLQRVKRYSHHYIWRVVRSKGIEHLRQFKAEMNYSDGWLIRQKEEMAVPSKNIFADVRIK